MLRHASLGGLIGALFGFWSALSPSLIPRTWWMILINVAMSMLFAYGTGHLIGYALRHLARLISLRVTAAARAVRIIRWLGYAAVLAISVGVWFWAIQQQRDVSRTVNLKRHFWLTQIFGALSGILAFVAVLLLIRTVSHAIHRLYTGVHRFITQPLLATSVFVVALALALLATNNVVVRTAANAVAHQMETVNRQTTPGVHRPTSALRSGGPGSTRSWASLGRKGQDFVASGPTAAQIRKVTGRSAMVPIRAYAGLPADRNLNTAAHAVLDELIRTHAFDRKVLVIYNTTGSGWVEEWSVSSVEYLTGGDCATASMQYSYLGSPGAFLLDRESPKEGAKALFNVIHGYWDRLDPARRPRLYTSGVSLGAYGGQSAFSSADDMMSKVDGAVWTGSPGITPIWNELTSSRRQGSPEIAPVIGSGSHIRFIPGIRYIDRDRWGASYPQWKSPRIAYVQHSSDPVTWWQPSLIWREPDWIRERAGIDTNPRISWTPWSSFWQVTADMAIAVSAPGGHGHSYHQELIWVWSSVLGTDHITQAQKQAIAEDLPKTIKGSD
ncbi:alpha/beta-hydrolase family protein [Acidipropionibacterium virtanenii]|uniref:alpha/beta hydrolase n=1 Tax=Acidipropionibacterium virtanenii TaxID=2057246 RepID=UPI000DEC0AA8